MSNFTEPKKDIVLLIAITEFIKDEISNNEKKDIIDILPIYNNEIRILCKPILDIDHIKTMNNSNTSKLSLFKCSVSKINNSLEALKCQKRFESLEEYEMHIEKYIKRIEELLKK